MMNVSALLSALEQDDASVMERRAKRARARSVQFAVLEFLLIMGIGVFGLWRAWESANWDSFWTSTIPLIVFAFFPLLALVLPNRLWFQTERLRDGARGLREVAALGDERLAPVAVLQPAPLSSGEMPAGPLQIGPLKQRPSLAPYLPIWLATGFMPLFVLVVFGPLFLIPYDNFAPGGLSSPFFTFTPFLFFVPVALWIALLARRYRKQTLYVTADERGLEWQPRRNGRNKSSTKRITWDQVRSLSRVDQGLEGIYVLDASEADLIWTVGTTASEEESGASESLLRLIVTRTSKPLRDLSKVASELAQPGGNASRRLASRAPSAGGLATLPGVYAVGQRPKRRQVRAGLWVAGLVPVLLAGLLFGAGAWLQWYQPQYLAGIPARVYAEAPLFHDDLASQTGYWPVRQPTSDDPSGYAYVGGTYQLSGNVADNFVVALEAQQFGDAAYEVTATQSGVLPQNGGDGVGLALHATGDKDNFTVFQVTYTGAWELWQYKYVDNRASDNWSEVDSGESSAILRGSGEANRLLVVVRGSTYLLYVNDQFMGSYTVSSYDHLPTYGYAGVYLDESAMTGTFTQFSVYPVNPTTPWDYV